MPKSKYQKVWIGIDPGKSGGLACIVEGEGIRAEPMPSTEFKIAQWIRMLTEDWNVLDIQSCRIEKIHAMPSQGVTSMFSFGQNYGFLRGCLFSSGVSFEEVTPRTWQKEFGIQPRDKKKKETKNQFKNRLLAKCQQLFPNYDLWKEPRSKGKQLAVCDAILIAEYCRRVSK